MQLGHLRAKWCLPKFLSKLAFFTTSSMLFPLIRLTSTRAMRENKSNHLALSKRTDLLKTCIIPPQCHFVSIEDLDPYLL